MAGVQQRSPLTQRSLQDMAQGHSTAAGREGTVLNSSTKKTFGPNGRKA